MNAWQLAEVLVSEPYMKWVDSEDYGKNKSLNLSETRLVGIRKQKKNGSAIIPQ